jgi:hypothetical protein
VKVVCKAEHGHGHGDCRLLTGSILAHELMHAWLRLKGTHWLLAPSISTLIAAVCGHLNVALLFQSLTPACFQNYL